MREYMEIGRKCGFKSKQDMAQEKTKFLPCLIYSVQSRFKKEVGSKTTINGKQTPITRYKLYKLYKKLLIEILIQTLINICYDNLVSNSCDSFHRQR